MKGDDVALETRVLWYLLQGLSSLWLALPVGFLLLCSLCRPLMVVGLAGYCIVAASASWMALCLGLSVWMQFSPLM
jgi:hypothetical protein